MTKRTLFGALLLALAVLWAPSVSAGEKLYTLNAQAVTDTGVSITFVDNGTGGNSQQFVARSVFVANDDTADEVFCNLRTRAATTSDFKIPFGASHTFVASPTNDDGGFFGIGCIASSGESTIIRVRADQSGNAGAHASPGGGGAAGGGLTDAELRASAVPVDTELPAAAAMSDNAANPTAPPVDARLMIWDGATWDRWTGAVSGGTGTSTADEATFTPATTPGTVAQCIEATDTMAAGTTGGMKCGADRELDVDAEQRGTWTVQPGNTANTTPWLTSLHDGTTKAHVFDLTNSNPLAVQPVDADGTAYVPGAVAASYGSAPASVAAAAKKDLTSDRQGVQFVIPNHPNSTPVEYFWTSAQTDDALVAVSAGTRIVVTSFQVLVSSQTTLSVAVRCGFAAATLTTAPTDGNTAVSTWLSHPGIVPGGGANNGPGFLVAGADGEDVRCTTGAATGSAGAGATIVLAYYTTAN